MPLGNSVFSYGFVARFFHWAMAVAIIGMLVLGLYMTGLPKGPDKMTLVGIHKAVGALILGAVILRFLWRQFTIVPALPGEMSTLERLGVNVSHFGLYFMMAFMPLVGWAASSARGYPVSVFGWYTLPNIVPVSKVWGSNFSELHYYGGYVFIVLISVHFLAALYHHFIRGDNVLRRMRPW